MTKSLKQIQKENRKFILEAIHSCSYEEALKKEEGRTCEYPYQTNYGVQVIIGDVKDYGYNRKKHFPDAFLIEIIGKPITLNRVLLAVIKSYNEIRNFDLDNWDLTRETLDQQSEETQREINKLLTII